jgi:DNA repair photolyase
LIDAFLLSEELAFYGIAIHNTAESFIRRDGIFQKRFLFYECPMKNGIAYHNLVSPFMPFFRKHEISAIIDQFRFMTSGHLRRYIDNTERFLKLAFEKQKEREHSRTGGK